MWEEGKRLIWEEEGGIWEMFQSLWVAVSYLPWADFLGLSE